MSGSLGHIAIIPDGNRRWARARGLAPWEGHKAGFGRIEELFDAIVEARIAHVTFWAASVENLTRRDKKEVSFLMTFLERKLTDLVREPRVHDNKIRIQVRGFWEALASPSLKKAILSLEEATRAYDQFVFTILFAYSGKREMLEAIEKMIEAAAFGRVFRLDEQKVKESLLTHDLPPVDLLIRTGGEPHLSTGFMMWDIADAQLYFTEMLFPDFGAKELKKAIESYIARERRFGA